MSRGLATLCGWAVLACLLVLGYGYRLAPEASAFVTAIVTVVFVLGAWLVAAVFVNVLSPKPKATGAKP